MTSEAKFLTDVCIHTYQYLVDCKKEDKDPAVWALDLIITFIENDLELYKTMRNNNG